jgi:hypothetical protein
MNYTGSEFEFEKKSFIDDDYYSAHRNNVCGPCCPYCEQESEIIFAERRSGSLGYEENY